MSKLFSVGLVAGGAAFTIAGIQAATSSTFTLSRIFTSWPISQAVWMVITGVAAMTLGLANAWRARNRFE